MAYDINILHILYFYNVFRTFLSYTLIRVKTMVLQGYILVHKPLINQAAYYINWSISRF